VRQFNKLIPLFTQLKLFDNSHTSYGYCVHNLFMVLLYGNIAQKS
jgi:hypothetical protein